MKTLITFAILLLTTQILIAGSAIAQEFIIPQSWEGVWETTNTEMDCVTFEVIDVSTTVDTLCAGNTFIPADALEDMECEGYATDTEFHLDCSGSMELYPGCTLNISYTIDTTRDGGHSEGVQIMSQTFIGNCFLEDSCTRNEFISDRLPDDPGCTPSPVPEQSPPLAGLLQNHPNPFNPSTNIQYVMHEPGYASLQVFSVTGRLVRTLVSAQHDRAATYQAAWDGRDDDGRPLPSGVFFYRLESPGGWEMKKMVLLK